QTYDGLDDFGAYFEYSDIPVVAEDSTATIPFIAVNYAEGSPDWGNKFTSDILINQTVIKANKTTHVYVFQGRNDDPGKSTAENPRWFAADPDMHNMLLVYFDPTGNYDENLGVHNWGGWAIGDAGWSTPKKVFSTAGETEGGQVVKAAMLSIEPGDGGAVKDGGLLIYEGGDANKRTGDVKIQLA